MKHKRLECSPSTKKNKKMYQNFWKNNKNVILVAVGMFIVSITTLLLLLNHEKLGGDFNADILHLNESDKEEITVKLPKKDYSKFEEVNEGPTVVLGADGLVEYINEDFEDISGYKLSEMIGEFFFSYVHQKDLGEILSSYNRVLSSSETMTMIGPIRIRNADDEYLMFMASMDPLVENEQILGVALTVYDITETAEDETEKEKTEKDKNDDEENINAKIDKEKLENESENAAEGEEEKNDQDQLIAEEEAKALVAEENVDAGITESIPAVNDTYYQAPKVEYTPSVQQSADVKEPVQTATDMVSEKLKKMQELKNEADWVVNDET